MSPLDSVRMLYGSILFGVFLNLILYGVLVVQVYLYYLTYKKDRIWIKLLVIYLFVVESVNVACDMHIIYESLVQKIGQPEALANFPTFFAAEPISVVIISTPIQLFLAWRIWLLTNSKILPFIISAMALVSLGGGIATAYGIIKVKTFPRLADLRGISTLVWLVTACAADILISISLVFTLHKKKTGFVATDDVLSRIIRMTIQTGLLTTVFALCDAALVRTVPGLNFIFDFALSKLYSNCLLTTLNARASIQASKLSTGDYSNPQRLGAGGGLGLGMPLSPSTPSKRSTYHPHNIELTPTEHSTGFYDDHHDSKRFEQSTTVTAMAADVDYGIMITKATEMGDTLELDRIRRKGV